MRRDAITTCGGCASSFRAGTNFICKDASGDDDANIELSGDDGCTATRNGDDGSSWWES